MTSIELLVLFLILLMTIPEACSLLRRPALSYPAFVCAGLLIGPLIDSKVAITLQEVGQIGFVFLLFEVGLEIDLPSKDKLLKPILHALRWVLPQYPVILIIGHYVGLSWLQALVVCSALSACAVGMAHSAWKNYPGLNPEAKSFTLQVMVILEVLTVILLAGESLAIGGGPLWLILLQLVGIVLVIYTCSQVSIPLTRALQKLLEQTTHWRLHLISALILLLAALGNRLGLSSPKTAFFLGLFASHVRHNQVSLEEFLQPVTRRMLIPIFFLALGTQIPIAALWSPAMLVAIPTAALLLLFRAGLHKWFAPLGGDAKAWLLLCPNFTMVALAASTLGHGGSVDPQVVVGLLMTGLLITLYSLFALPPAAAEPEPAHRPPPESN